MSALEGLGKSLNDAVKKLLRLAIVDEKAVKELVRDLVAGDYASVFRGRGIEFAEVREYLPGDDQHLCPAYQQPHYGSGLCCGGGTGAKEASNLSLPHHPNGAYLSRH